MKVGNRIRELRKQRDLTQEQLANIANISRTYLADIERDRYNPSLDTLELIAKSLNLTVSNLLDETIQIDSNSENLSFNKENLKNAITITGYDIKELALKANIGVTTIYEILNGKKKDPKSTTLSKLATALGIPMSEFFNSSPIESTVVKDKEFKELMIKVEKLYIKDKEFLINLIDRLGGN